MEAKQTAKNAIRTAALLLTGLVAVAACGEDGKKAKKAEAESDQTEKQYKSVTIGSQEWMAENLDVSTFRNGDPIPEVKTTQEWLAAHRSESPAWCYYNNDPQNGERFGKLYNWYAVSDPRGLAPAGWHVPADNEWQTLIKACAGSGGLSAAFEQLKKPDAFAAKAAGARWFKDASFNYMGKVAFWWSASESEKSNAWFRAMHFGYRIVDRDEGGMDSGQSVRCVRDTLDE